MTVVGIKCLVVELLTMFALILFGELDWWIECLSEGTIKLRVDDILF